MTEARLGALLDLARAAVLAGGEAIRPFMRAPVRAEDKADGSPVTAADLAADRAIAAVLAPSGFPVLSEEAPYAGGAAPAVWVVDPLDGTRAFVTGSDEFTVNVALVSDGFPVLGAVHVPASGATYGGSARGAWKETPGRARQPIAVREPERLVVLTSRRYRGEPVERVLAAARADGHAVEARAMSSSVKLCLVAEGAADLYLRPGPTNAWDTAAAQAVLEAAGGFLGAWSGSRLGVDPAAPLNPPVVAWGGARVGEAWPRWSGR